MHMKENIAHRMDIERAWTIYQELKALTKQVPASEWTPEYRALAELIHTMGREVFNVKEDVPLLGYSRLLELMKQFGIEDTDTLKHRLEEWDRENNW